MKWYSIVCLFIHWHHLYVHYPCTVVCLHVFVLPVIVCFELMFVYIFTFYWSALSCQWFCNSHVAPLRLFINTVMCYHWPIFTMLYVVFVWILPVSLSNSISCKSETSKLKFVGFYGFRCMPDCEWWMIIWPTSHLLCVPVLVSFGTYWSGWDCLVESPGGGQRF
jgi:hypothetical protein